MDESHRTATLLEIVYPGQTNSQGTLFGSHALSLMDRLSLTPVKEGELIELKGEVVHVGRTSLRLRIEMFREDLLSGDRSLCTTGEFVMVAVDAAGRPAPIAR